MVNIYNFIHHYMVAKTKIKTVCYVQYVIEFSFTTKYEFWNIREIKEFLALTNSMKRTSFIHFKQIRFRGNPSDLSCYELKRNASDAYNRQGMEYT